MTQYHDPEPNEHSAHRPLQRSDECDPKRTGRPTPEAESALPIQRMAQQTPTNQAVQRAVQHFLQRTSAITMPRPGEDTEQHILSMSGGGTGIDPSAKGKLEEGLGADLSGVRVHIGGEADRLARSVASVAFTSGQDIFFREGAYNPGSDEGMRLLAHEATHTVQQAAGPVAGTPTQGGVSVSDPSDIFEQAATQTAERVVNQSAIQEQDGGSSQPSNHTTDNAASVQRKAAPGEASQAARNWLAILPRAGKKGSAALTEQQSAVLNTLRQQRAQLIEDSRLHLVNYRKTQNAGYTFNGKDQGDPDPGVLMSAMGVASDEKTRETHVNWLVWSELKTQEGATSIDTYDSLDFASDEGVGGEVMSEANGNMNRQSNEGVQEAMKDLIDPNKGINDPEARDMFLDAGISLENGKLLVVDPETGVIEEGRKALELLQFNNALLSLFIAVSEDPAHSKNVVNAQWRAFKRHAGKVPDFVYKEWGEEKEDSIALLSHISSWLPAYGWETYPTEYQNTYGDLEKILIAFGKLIGQRQYPSGAYIVEQYWQVLGEERLRTFGAGIGRKGVAMEAFQGQSPLDLIDKDIATDESYRDHVFFPLEGKKGYFALPALPIPPEKGATPARTAPAAQANQNQPTGDKNTNKNQVQNQNKKGKTGK